MENEERVHALMREGHAEASARLIARLEVKRDAAVSEKNAVYNLAERTVLAAIDALGRNWSVRRKLVHFMRDGLADAHTFLTQAEQDGRGDHPGRAGPRADVDLGEDSGAADNTPGWRALMADQDASSLCRQIMRLHMLLGFAG